MRLNNTWWAARAVLVLHFTFTLITWFTLPSRVPTHFGLNGEANAWGATSFFSWFTLFLVSCGIHLLTYFLMSPAARETWNIPEKEHFLKLTREQQEPVIKLMRVFGGGTSTCVALTMVVLQVGMYLTAKGYTKGLPWYIHAGMFVPVAVLLMSLIPWSNAVKRAINAAHTGAPIS